jgi:hypothetical protein
MSAEAPASADCAEGSPAGSLEPDAAAETRVADSSIPGTGRGDSAPDEAEDDAAVEEALRFALDTFLLDLSDDEGDDEGSKRDAAAVDAVLHEVLHEALREGTVEGDEAVADDAGDRADEDGLSEECRRMILELDAVLHFAGASDDDTLGATVDVALDELVDAVLGEYCNTVGRVMFELDAAMRGAGASEEDYLGAAVDASLDALLDAFGPKGPSAAERARAAAVRIQAVHRGNAGRARVAEMRRVETTSGENFSRETVSSETVSSETVEEPKPHIPRAPSAPVPANKSVRRRLERSGAVFAERRTTSPDLDANAETSRRAFASSLDATRRAVLYRKIDLAFAFDLQGGSVLDGPDDRDEDGASRATEESDAGTSSEGRGDENEDEADASPSRSGVRSASPNGAFRARSSPTFFPNLLEDSFDDGEGASTFPSPHAARRSPLHGEKNARAAFVDVGPELDPDVARAGRGGVVSSSKREGHGAAAPLRRGRGFGESAAERAAKENELRWRKERREREKRKLEDERRRFEVLQLELEAIEARRLEQARAREDKKAAEAELRSAREENKKLERRVREERLAWENQGKRLMAEQMERRRGLFPGVSVGGHEARSRRDPLYVRMQKEFEDRAETQAEETRRVALEARRARKTGGAKKSRFQTVFENSRVPSRGFVGGDELDVTLDESAAFLPPLSANDQAAARFARQRRYGQIVKRLHAPRVDPDARTEIARRADANRPGFENLSALVPVAFDPSASLVSPGGKHARVYDEKGVGRYATAKKGHVPYRYANEVAAIATESEYDIDGRRRVRSNDRRSNRDGPFGPFPNVTVDRNFLVGGKAVPNDQKTGGFRSGQRALSRTRKAQRDAARAAMDRLAGRDASIRDTQNALHDSLVMTTGGHSPYARLEARDPRYDARHDPMIGFDPRLEDEDGNAVTGNPVTLPPPGAAPAASPAKGKGFRTLLRERQLAAIEARQSSEAAGDAAESAARASAASASKRAAYVNVDDIPCVGASTFGRTEGLVGLEDAEKKDSLDGSEPPADGEEEGGGDDDDDVDDNDDDDGDDDDDDDED